MEKLCAREGVICCVFSFDIVIDPKHDILEPGFFSMLRYWCYSGLVWGLHGGPVCSTWSRARWRPGGPPPLRDRRRPFGLPNLSEGNVRSLHRGAEFFLRHMDLKRAVLANEGPSTSEHPADPVCDPYALIVDTVVIKDCLDKQGGGRYTVLDQCMYGCSTRKRTGAQTHSSKSWQHK